MNKREMRLTGRIKRRYNNGKENEKISTSDIAIKLGISVRTVKRRIKQMPNVSYIGSGYSGHWEIEK